MIHTSCRRESSKKGYCGLWRWCIGQLPGQVCPSSLTNTVRENLSLELVNMLTGQTIYFCLHIISHLNIDHTDPRFITVEDETTNHSSDQIFPGRSYENSRGKWPIVAGYKWFSAAWLTEDLWNILLSCLTQARSGCHSLINEFLIFLLSLLKSENLCYIPVRLSC